MTEDKNLVIECRRYKCASWPPQSDFLRSWTNECGKKWNNLITWKKEDDNHFADKSLIGKWSSEKQKGQNIVLSKP